MGSPCGHEASISDGRTGAREGPLWSSAGREYLDRHGKCRPAHRLGVVLKIISASR